MNHDRMNEEASNTGTPVKDAVPVTIEEGPVKPMNWFWIVVAILSAVYVVIPEPTDALPILGWLDEGTAVLMLTYALERLGIRIPFLSRVLGRKKQKKD